MKLYDSIGPNPHVVRMFAAEKGITLDKQTVDLRGGENRRAPYNETVNVAGTLPALQLDDGGMLAEITVICEYLEEMQPDPPLIGTTPKERAETRMWTRRIDLLIVEPMTNGFRSAEGRGLFEGRMRLMCPEGAADLKAIAQDRLRWLDGQMKDNSFVCGDRFTLADVLLYCFVAFGTAVGQPPPPEAAWIKAWFDRVKERPSTKA